MLSTWLQLLRIPNLFTVPGDPLAGFFLAYTAGGVKEKADWLLLWIGIPVSLLLYCAGLLQNDYFDREKDRRERPSRPIPAGLVRPATVISVAALLSAAALVFAYSGRVETGITATALLFCIALYNGAVKKIAVAGPLFMGLCRALSFLLGAGLTGMDGLFQPAVIYSAVFLCLYIGVVTQIAARETEPYQAGPLRWMPGCIVAVWFVGLHLCPGLSIPLPGRVGSVLLGALALCWVFYCGGLLSFKAPPSAVQQNIGRFLRGLLLIQGTVIILSGYVGFCATVLLLIAWPISQGQAKRFYAS